MKKFFLICGLLFSYGCATQGAMDEVDGRLTNLQGEFNKLSLKTEDLSTKVASDKAYVESEIDSIKIESKKAVKSQIAIYDLIENVNTNLIRINKKTDQITRHLFPKTPKR
jgi:hypothetical protein